MKRATYLRLFSKKCFVILAISTVLILAMNAEAGIIVQAESATANQPLLYPSDDINNMINQSQLSIQYNSGITDFDTYIALKPTDGNMQSDLVSFNVPIVDIDFYLGASFTIESIALWNRGSSVQGIKEFDLIASNDPAFTNSTLLGNYTATAVLGDYFYTEPEVFSFAPTSAMYIRISVLSSYHPGIASLNEVAFEAVPEPVTLVLLAIGGLALRKRK